jgi:DNA-binding transcriptional LysR family regulator
MYDWAELRHFRYLLAILERQGFRIAAEQLHTSQPNLTVQARQFQENASIRLFQKMKNGRIRPTETGIAFISLARLLLETRDEVIDTLIAIERGEIGSVRFGCAPLVDQSLFRSFCGLHKEILPACSIRPTHADPAQLTEEVVSGAVDAAIVTLPLRHPDLRIEEIRADRLVVCLRRDNPLAQKAALNVADLQKNLTVLYHPQRHPDGHEMLLQLLTDAGVKIDEYSLASHPSEMQMLVKEGYGFTLIREGTPLDDELTIRPVAGVNWTVNTAVIYHRERHPKTVPILVKKFRRQFRRETNGLGLDREVALRGMPRSDPKPPQGGKNLPVQMTLLRSRPEASRDGIR